MPDQFITLINGHAGPVGEPMGRSEGQARGSWVPAGRHHGTDELGLNPCFVILLAGQS